MTDDTTTHPRHGGEDPLRDEADQRPVAAHRTVHEGMVWDLVRDTIDFAPGVRFDREYIRHTGAVAVLAVDEADRVLLIRQYRHPVGHRLWEIPAGLLDLAGEPPHVAAARELAEEAGCEPVRMSTLVDLRPSPGGSDEVIRVYLAEGVRESEEEFERVHEEAELIRRWVPLDEAVAAVLEGRITNGTAVAGLLALQALRGGGAPAAALRPADAPFMERPGRD
ncbi:NTP pyrophosphohydrolase [Brachybacterium sp. HMSC06H03]|uniref:NUDIX domain-containing protein n=1 Tax=Brachybacterium sp. HMSC06H03 TaxID=1581127 RepID=UPI0008A15B14|nr:NUDIX hydrolase [Brachybacterium sp. HMSC06H03]OFT52159.1 NTP pyrophosphohydrolase [Brachybacterium sp. HMSC06H03]